MRLKTENVEGKEYVKVNERVKYFRDSPKYQGWSLTCDIIEMSPDTVSMKATVKNEVGAVIATGHASEDRRSSRVNETSYLENCETSAWGRALGNLGIGIDAFIASHEEVEAAIRRQATKPLVSPDRLIDGQDFYDPANSSHRILLKSLFAKHNVREKVNCDRFSDALKAQNSKLNELDSRLAKMIKDLTS